MAKKCPNCNSNKIDLLLGQKTCRNCGMVWTGRTLRRSGHDPDYFFK